MRACVLYHSDKILITKTMIVIKHICEYKTSLFLWYQLIYFYNLIDTIYPNYLSVTKGIHAMNLERVCPWQLTARLTASFIIHQKAPVSHFPYIS